MVWTWVFLLLQWRSWLHRTSWHHWIGPAWRGRLASGVEVGEVLDLLVLHRVFQGAVNGLVHAIVDKALIFYKGVILEYSNLISEFLVRLLPETVLIAVRPASLVDGAVAPDHLPLAVPQVILEIS